MLDIRQSQAAIITCQDQPSMLDRLAVIPRALTCRVASDEVLVVGARSDALALHTQVAALQGTSGMAGMSMDVSDGWSAWTVSGSGIDQMLARLSGNPMPAERPSLVQGTFAQVGSKVILLEKMVHILVPSPVGHFLRKRILSACADLSPKELNPAPLAVDRAGAIVTTRIRGAA